MKEINVVMYKYLLSKQKKTHSSHMLVISLVDISFVSLYIIHTSTVEQF